MCQIRSSIAYVMYEFLCYWMATGGGLDYFGELDHSYHWK